MGKIGGMQKLSLSDICFGIPHAIKHELMHALGFYHEQARTDRDDYVNIHYDNIWFSNAFHKNEFIQVFELKTKKFSMGYL